MREFIIPVEWTMCGTVCIGANSAEEAYDIFNENIDDLPLPEGEYVDGSFQMSPMDDMTPEEYIEFATENYCF